MTAARVLLREVARLKRMHLRDKIAGTRQREQMNSCVPARRKKRDE
jgi:hypothetical protein